VRQAQPTLRQVAVEAVVIEATTGDINVKEWHGVCSLISHRL